MQEIAENAVNTAPETGMSAEDSGLYGEDVVQMFEGMHADDESVEPGQGEEVEAQPEPEAKPEEAPAEPEPGPEIPMPEGWNDAMWQAATPELRGKVDSMVKAHAEAIAAKEKAMQEAAAQHREQAMKANAEMQTSLGIMRRVVEGEFASINWAELAKSDPALYVDLQAQYQQRMSAIQQMQQNVAAQSAQIAQAQAAEAQKALQAEFAAVLPKVQALVGAGFEGKAFGRDLVAYLQKSGVPMEAIGAMSKGYEMELAAKAMLYDKSLEARQAAAAKVAEAPKVQAPRGAAPADDGDAIAKARARLSRNPNSLDAQIGLFEAMY